MKLNDYLKFAKEGCVSHIKPYFQNYLCKNDVVLRAKFLTQLLKMVLLYGRVDILMYKNDEGKEKKIMEQINIIGLQNIPLEIWQGKLLLFFIPNQ